MATSIATTCPPFPEIFDDAALYYQPDYPDELAAKMDQVHRMSDAERRRCHDAVLARAETFGWAAAADKTIRQLRKAIEDGGRE